MATFLCWDPDEEDESDAESDDGNERNLVEAIDAESAAEAYAETRNNRGDFAKERSVCVRDERDGELTRWSVEAAVEYRYTAAKEGE